MTPGSPETIEHRLERFREDFESVRAEIAKVVVGQRDAVEHLLATVFAGEHVLLTGAPGLGRTLLVRTLATALDLTYGRIQFTPDLLPSDIIGTEVLEKDPDGRRHFRFFKGPIFCSLLLADEINRSPARAQAALLEAMHERQITVGGQTYWLGEPFVVVATRNSFETDGVWRMPEAQIDRFGAAIELSYPDEDEEIELLARTTGTEAVEAGRVLGSERVVAMQKLAVAVAIAPAVKHFALRIVRASRPEPGGDEGLRRDIRLGASPRAAQSILRAAKVLAIVRGRCHVSAGDVESAARPALTHRLLLDLRAASRGVTIEDVMERLIRAARAARVPADAYRFNARRVLRPAGE